MTLPRIERWSVHEIGTNNYAGIYRLGVFVKGFVYDHPRFKDGTAIRTGRALLLDAASLQLTTINSQFSLGIPDKEYAKRYLAMEVSL